MTESAVSYPAAGVQPESKSPGSIPRWKTIPWARLAVDVLLLASMVLVSSKLLAP